MECMPCRCPTSTLSARPLDSRQLHHKWPDSQILAEGWQPVCAGSHENLRHRALHHAPRGLLGQAAHRPGPGHRQHRLCGLADRYSLCNPESRAAQSFDKLHHSRNRNAIFICVSHAVNLGTSAVVGCFAMCLSWSDMTSMPCSYGACALACRLCPRQLCGGD